MTVTARPREKQQPAKTAAMGALKQPKTKVRLHVWKVDIDLVIKQDLSRALDKREYLMIIRNNFC